MRSVWIPLLVAMSLVAACSSDAPVLDILEVPPTSGVGGGGAGQVAPFPPSAGGGSGGPGEQGVIRFDDAAIDLGKAGAYPSDLAVDSKGALYTVDGDQVPCKVRAYATDGGTAPLTTIPIAAADLVDMDGTSPALSPSSFGSGLFGAFTGDLAIAFDRWLLVTVGAGNSISSDTGGPRYLANLVVLDTANGEVAQTVNLAQTISRSVQLSSGASRSAVTQSMPSGVLFLPAGDGTKRGRIFVAMSNGMGDSFGLSDYFPGTVQEWEVDFTASLPVKREVTRTHVSKHYNPVALSGYVSANGRRTLILTSAGASRFDENYVLQPLNSAYLEFLDLDADAWRPNWELNLGPVLPSVAPLAHGSDGNGVRFALFTSQTFGALYAVELTGLESNPVDPSRIRLLRTVDLVPGGSRQAGSGYQPSVAVTSSGRTALVSSFSSSSLMVLALPSDIEYGQVAIDPAPFDTANLASAKYSGIGAVAIPRGGAADAYCIVNGTYGPGWTPLGSACIGSLTVPDGLP